MPGPRAELPQGTSPMLSINPGKCGPGGHSLGVPQWGVSSAEFRGPGRTPFKVSRLRLKCEVHPANRAFSETGG